jgi:2-oxoglutarate ferredoxin oxidoreductase subunit delta
MEKNATKAAPRRVWDYPPREAHPEREIFVYNAWCKACGLCYEFCPTGVFTSDRTGRPVVSHPDKCIACYLCEMLCPDMALTVYKERKGKTAGAPGADDDGEAS